MEEYTPIHEINLSREGKDLLKQIRKVFSYGVKRAVIQSKIFEMLLNGIPEQQREAYVESIPYKGKFIVRMR